MLLFRLKKQTSTNVANTTFKVSEYLILLKAKSTVSHETIEKPYLN